MAARRAVDRRKFVVPRRHSAWPSAVRGLPGRDDRLDRTSTTLHTLTRPLPSTSRQKLARGNTRSATWQQIKRVVSGWTPGVDRKTRVRVDALNVIATNYSTLGLYAS